MRNWNELYTRYLHKRCSPDEIRLLLEHFRLDGDDFELQSRVRSELANTNIPVSDTPEVAAAFDRIRHRLMTRIADETTSTATRTRRIRWIPYAAAVLMLALAGAWLFGPDQFVNRKSSIVNAEDIGPGGNRAKLILADGRTIDLSSSHEGIVVDDGEITYVDGTEVLAASHQPPGTRLRAGTKNLAAESSSFLSLSTPKGGTYQITLSDGTKVWLNAASTLKYPSRFGDDERVVELEGEAYFDVSERWLIVDDRYAREKMPFLVKTNTQTVEVMGTQFNISAYADEPVVKTTLVEGRIKVIRSSSWNGAMRMDSGMKPSQELLLKPGEQANLTDISIQKQQVDVEQFIAWKDGLFSFNETELHAAMNQLSRWYDIAITYEDDVPSTHYYGAISRNESLASVLELLQQSGLNFKIEKVQDVNKLTVLP